MKKWSIRLLLPTMIIMSTAIFASEGKTLYSFTKGTDGWWSYKGKAKITLSQEKPGSDGTGGALKADYEYGGVGSYLGIGIQPKWAMHGSSDFSAYSKGTFEVTMKADTDTAVRIELRMSNKKKYTANLKVNKEWQTFQIKFNTFKSKTTPLDLTTTTEISQIVIIPRASANKKHILWIDNIKVVE